MLTSYGPGPYFDLKTKLSSTYGSTVTKQTKQPAKKQRKGKGKQK